MDRGLLLTVNYNSTKETIQYIGSLLYLKNINHIDIIIIDNNSNNIIQDKLRHFIEENDLHNIRLICLQDNVGYFGAVRIVMDKYINNINSYNFIIVSNNDIIIKDVHFLNKIFNKMGNDFVIAPKIISLINNVNQNPFRECKMSKKEHFFWRLYFSNYYVAKILLLIKHLFRHFVRKNEHDMDDVERYIYAAHGAFLIFSNKYFNNGGYIDNGFFLYGEENTVAAIIEKINGTIKYHPDIIVFHSEHKTIPISLTRRKYQYQVDANEYVTNNYSSMHT